MSWRATRTRSRTGKGWPRARILRPGKWLQKPGGCYRRAMKQRGQAVDRHGRTWTATVVSESEAEEADFRFWHEGLSPEERVNAVQDCLLSALKAKGISEIPRLKKVYRVLKPKRKGLAISSE